MYYRKYFEGSILNNNNYKSVVIAGYSMTAYVEQSKVIGKALEVTLKKAGINAYYDEESLILYFDKQRKAGIGIVANINGIPSYYFFAGNVNGQAFTQSYISGNATFSGTNYKFYITLIGEPTAAFTVAVGTYNIPTSVVHYITIGFGKNKKTEKDIFLFGTFSFFNGSLPYFFIKNIDGTQDQYKAPNTQINFSTVQLAGYSNGVVLKDIFDTTGMYTINNCYMGCSTLTAGSYNFYVINNEEYYRPNAYFTIKCPSKII